MKENDNHKINFGPGPATLPQEVLRQASEAIIDYNGSGLSILEIPHRGKAFDAILEESKALVKELCGLNNDYEILWLHGGGRLAFCMIPMNFLTKETTAGYVDSGAWSAEAIEYARYYGNVQVLSSSVQDNYTHLPEWPGNILKDLAYVHFTTNNTIYGTQWKSIPKTDVPLIADMSSDIFSCKRDYTNCSAFYAVAQKNIGPAGATLAVLHKDLLKKATKAVPPMLNYAKQAAKHSVLNTPPVFAIYVSLLMLRWTKAKGIEAIEKENKSKAALLYNELERNRLFKPVVSNPDDRSMMNACFVATEKEYERAFSLFCDEQDIVGIEGHRTVGGFRVSMYNAITLQNVERLVQVMKQFEDKYA